MSHQMVDMDALHTARPDNCRKLFVILVRLQQAGRLNGPISVTFVPATTPAGGSRPSIAEIALYTN